MTDYTRILGLMSGTSLDGIDAALIETDGAGHLEMSGIEVTREYSAEIRSLLGAATQGALELSTEVLKDKAQWPRWLKTAEALVNELHAALIASIQVDAGRVDTIGFHGQTVVHRPDEGFTLQLGDGEALAAAVKTPVVWDFRSADMRAGGQGAPLAPFYHFALAKRMGLSHACGFLNLGGVGNITYVDPASSGPEAPGALLAFDTGPANGPLDDAVREMTEGQQMFDAHGALAQKGRVDAGKVDALLRHSFFGAPPPKSLDRHSFSFDAFAALELPDRLASLVEVITGSVKRALAYLPQPIETLYVCGGGRKNLALMERLHNCLPCKVGPVEALGVNGDFVEAQAFACLAARSVAGLPLSAPMTTGCANPVTGGILSLPQ